MVDHPIAEGRGADHPLLTAFGDGEKAIRARAIAALAQLFDQLDQVFFIAELEGCDIRSPPFAAPHPAVGFKQVLETAELSIEVAEGLWHGQILYMSIRAARGQGARP